MSSSVDRVPARPRRLLPRLLLAWLLALTLFVAIGLALALAMHRQFAAWGVIPVHVVVNGRELVSGVDFERLSAGHVFAAGLGLALALLVLLTLMSLGLLLGLGLPLLVLATVLLALALPWLLVLLPLWWLLRRLMRERVRTPPGPR